MYMGDLNKSKVVFSRCQNDVNKLNIDDTNFTKWRKEHD